MVRWGRVCGVVGVLLAIVVSAGSAIGQGKPDAPTPKTSAASRAQATSDQTSQGSPEFHPQQDDNPKRILGIIPNFQTTNDTPAVQEPLSVRVNYAHA